MLQRTSVLFDEERGGVFRVLLLLIEQKPLPAKYNDHPLKGQWHGFRDLHIEPDRLVLYRGSSGSHAGNPSEAHAAQSREIALPNATARCQGQAENVNATSGAAALMNDFRYYTFAAAPPAKSKGT